MKFEKSDMPEPVMMSERHDDPYALIGALNKNEYRAYQRDGYQIFLNVSESRQMAKRAVGQYEPEKFKAIGQALDPGNVFLDIGGNKGDFALLAASIVGPDGFVITVEPHPENAKWIEQSIALNAFGNISVQQTALADKVAEAALHIGPKSGHHSLEEQSRDRGTIMVPITTLDTLVAKAGLDRLDIIKIDVEGAEDRVISGGQDTIARFRPLIFIDIHDIGDERLMALAVTLKRLDYSIEALDGSSVGRLIVDQDHVLTPA